MICSALGQTLQNGKARICNSRWAFRTYCTVVDLIRWGEILSINTAGNSVGGTGCTNSQLSRCQGEKMNNRSKTLVAPQRILFTFSSFFVNEVNFSTISVFHRYSTYNYKTESLLHVNGNKSGQLEAGLCLIKHNGFCINKLNKKLWHEIRPQAGKSIPNGQRWAYFAGGARSADEFVSGGAVGESSGVLQESVIWCSRTVKGNEEEQTYLSADDGKNCVVGKWLTTEKSHFIKLGDGHKGSFISYSTASWVVLVLLDALQTSEACRG